MNLESAKSNLFSYLDPQQFLSDYWESKQQKNQKLSIRSWARQMGIRAHNPLYEMVRGKRRVSKRYVPVLSRYFGFNSKEQIYFESMIELQRSKTSSGREFYINIMESIAPKRMIPLWKMDSFRFLSRPIHMILLEMSVLKNFNPSPRWIKKALKKKTTLNEIESAIETLHHLGLITKDSVGRWQKTHEHNYSKIDHPDEALRKYQAGVLELAAEALEDQALEKREYNSFSFNIESSRISEAKKAIRKMINDFIVEFEASPNNGDQTYHLSCQFFALTHSTNQPRSERTTS